MLSSILNSHTYTTSISLSPFPLKQTIWDMSLINTKDAWLPRGLVVTGGSTTINK